MINNTLKVEYYGLEACDCKVPTITEIICTFPDYIDIKTIIKVHSKVELSFDNSNEFQDSISIGICSVSLNIEYIDNLKEDTISILYHYMYVPIKYFVNDFSSSKVVNPKIGAIDVKYINRNSFYLYLA
ncbi:MAG: hypothetical protein ACRC68_04685, partial [Clostridium sp.]